MALSKAQILSHAGSLSRVEVHVPSWADPASGDDVVLVRGLTLREFEAAQAENSDVASGVATAKVMAACILDADGTRLFDPDTDASMLAELPLKEASAISKAIMQASGLADGEPDKVVAKAVSDAEGNSAATAGDGSSSS